MQWMNDLPAWAFLIVTLGMFVGIALGGLYGTRPLVRRIVGQNSSHNRSIEAFIGAIAVIYGLIAGLIAIGVWTEYETADDVVSREASALGALYFDVQAYPQPYRNRLQSDLRAYAQYTIDAAWPLQREGIVPTQGTEQIDRIGRVLDAFRPKTLSDEIVAETAQAQFNKMVELRRQRLHAVTLALPPPLWAVILLGAAVVIFLSYFLSLERFPVHVILTASIATMIGLLVFMTSAIEHPFGGQVRVGPEAFQLIYDQVMAPGGNSR
ncbi:MAG: DUF4239 domain-containing protein [Candidatus Eremiobacteraeota bacterium]|nr:DUF4239 domain-containing protein [Candidatus Eremiobacteraeota bacterium]